MLRTAADLRVYPVVVFSCGGQGRFLLLEPLYVLYAVIGFVIVGIFSVGVAVRCFFYGLHWGQHLIIPFFLIKLISGRPCFLLSFTFFRGMRSPPGDPFLRLLV